MSSFLSNSISLIAIPTAPTAIPQSRAIYPAFLPITSTTLPSRVRLTGVTESVNHLDNGIFCRVVTDSIFGCGNIPVNCSGNSYAGYAESWKVCCSSESTVTADCDNAVNAVAAGSFQLLLQVLLAFWTCRICWSKAWFRRDLLCLKRLFEWAASYHSQAVPCIRNIYPLLLCLW